MHKIMFVCHGNICRSPMAEFLLKTRVQRLGVADDFEISSSAVSRETIWNGVGEPVYPPAKKLLESLGIDCEEKRSQELTYADGEAYDLLICMDDSNVARAKRIVGEKNAKKCVKMLSFAGINRDVADPWYTRDFKATYEDLETGIDGLLTSLGY